MFNKLFDPHFAFSTLLDGYDLSGVHCFACLFGAIMAIYVMKLWDHGSVTLNGDCVIVQWTRRIALLLLTLSMLWSLAYSTQKGWQPWPPDLFALIGVDIFLASTILVAFKRNRALG